jgi:hypothetical protein
VFAEPDHDSGIPPDAARVNNPSRITVDMNLYTGNDGFGDKRFRSTPLDQS